jgi:hypothetical protein
MCGIAGQVLFDKKKGFTKEQAINATALLLNLQQRGGEAWGFYLEKAKNNSHLYCGEKMEGLPGELFKTQSTPTKFFREGSIIYFTDAHTFLMHTRLHTQGIVEHNENNHPFVTKNFILAHNGSVHNDVELKREFKIETDIECDSYVIVALIQHFFDAGKTVSESIAAMSRALRGNYACWLYHKDEKELYLFRHGTSPLSYYLDVKNKLLMFASTEANILTAYNDKSINTDIVDIDSDVIYKFEDNIIKNIGKLEPQAMMCNQSRGNAGGMYRGSEFNTGIVENASSNFEYLFDLLEKYETPEEDNTIIGITPQGEVQILIKPKPLIMILDEYGFAKYKSNIKLYDESYVEYDISSIEEFNRVTDRFRESFEKDEEEDNESCDDKTNSTTSGKTLGDIDFETALHDLGDTIDCKVLIHDKTITFMYEGKGELPPDVKKMFKKVGLHFRHEKKLVIKNNKHHHLSLEIIMKKLKLQEQKKKNAVIDVPSDKIPPILPEGSSQENQEKATSGMDNPTGEDNVE